MSIFGRQTNGAAGNLEIRPTIGIMSKTKETFIEDLHATSADQTREGTDGYRSFCFDVHNKGKEVYHAANLYVRIDGGKELRWANLDIQPQARLFFHVYYVNMKLVTPGQHKVDFYANNALLSSCVFTLRQGKTASAPNLLCGSDPAFRIPATSLITSHNLISKERAPYAAFHYEFADSQFQAISVDFQTKYQPMYTYLCPLDWQLRVTPGVNGFQKTVKPREAYAGLQTTDHGRIIIFSIWDTTIVDGRGRETLVKGHLVYHKHTDGWLEIVEEGDEQGNYSASFVSCRMAYDWKIHTRYRMMIKSGINPATGNTTNELWMHNLSDGTQECLMIYDLGVKGVYILSACGFLECYAPGTSGDVRDLTVYNVKACHAKTGSWKDVTAIKSSIFGGVGEGLNGSGSYSYWSDGRRLLIQTCGVPGMGHENGNCRFPITNI